MVGCGVEDECKGWGALLPVLTLRPYESLCGGGGASSPHCLGGPLLAFKMPVEAPGSKPSQEPSPTFQALGRRKSVVSEPCWGPGAGAGGLLRSSPRSGGPAWGSDRTAGSLLCWSEA